MSKTKAAPTLSNEPLPNFEHSNEPTYAALNPRRLPQKVDNNGNQIVRLTARVQQLESAVQYLLQEVARLGGPATTPANPESKTKGSTTDG